MASRSLVLILAVLAALAAAGCGYFEADEAHPAPRTPLLPPTTGALAAPSVLTPTTEGPAAPAPEPTPVEVPEPATEQDQPDGENGESDSESVGESEQPVSDSELALLEIVVVNELNHDPTAFTQGFEISDGRLYESTGAPGDRTSSLRELDRGTGEILRLELISEDVFAEGLTFVDGRIYQLTWTDGVALVWDPEEMSILDRFNYEGEGWGLCYNDRFLVMSDGSAELHFRDPVTFERVGRPVLVTLEGSELPSLNELECVDNTVYANVWQTDLIVQIDPLSGRVLAVADASELGQPRPDDPDAVLNGIAWDPTTETFLVTGKDWPTIYEITLQPTEPPRGAGPRARPTRIQEPAETPEEPESN